VRTATVKELSTNIRDLLAEVKKGREVTITAEGKPVAVLTGLRSRKPSLIYRSFARV